MIILKMSNRTARRLSYLIGHSDEANMNVQVAMQAAKLAEHNVRDMITTVASEVNETLPENYNVEFIDEENELRITPNQPMNGVAHE